MMLTGDDAAFADQWATAWGGAPRVFRDVLREPAFSPMQFLQALSRTAQAMVDCKREPVGRATLDGRAPAIHELMGFFPAPNVTGFEQYVAQVGSLFPGADFSVILDRVEIVLPELRQRLEPLLHGLFERVGYPVRGIHSCIYAGSYGTTPFGIHMDDCHVLMATGIGSKKVAFWPREYFEHREYMVMPGSQAHAGAALEALLQDATLLEIGPHDLMYWPAGAWHLAINDSRDFRASLSIGIYHRGENAEILRKQVALPPVQVANSNHRSLDALDLDGFASTGDEAASMTPRFEAMWDALRAAMDAKNAAAEAYATHALTMLSSAGFGPLPSTSAGVVPEHHALADDTPLRLDDRRALRWHVLDDRVVAAAHGHVFVFRDAPTAVDDILRRLARGAPATVGELRALIAPEHAGAMQAFLVNGRLSVAGNA